MAISMFKHINNDVDGIVIVADDDDDDDDDDNDVDGDVVFKRDADASPTTVRIHAAFLGPIAGKTRGMF